ncbi:MAG: ATP-binding protein [Candidatus Magnetominusculus sp. LBB02]|nr:ATP-binding protein [Candidatus Magnetominusculus sp. LBB02]
MHKIHIRNFGPIEHLEMDIKDYLVLIGEQATGKSTLSKLIYFFRTIKDEMYKYFRDTINNSSAHEGIDSTFLTASLRGVIRQKFLNIYGSSYSMRDLFATYKYDNDKSITISSTGNQPLHIAMSGTLENNYKRVFENCFNNIMSINDAITGSSSDVDISMINQQKDLCFKDLKAKLSLFFNDDTSVIYIPAGRAMATVFADQMNVEDIDYKDILTGSFIERIKSYRVLHLKDVRQNYGRTPVHNFADDRLKSILKGDYAYEKVSRDEEKIKYEERLYIKGNKFVKMQFASSGQQECLWILLSLNKILNDYHQHNKQKVLFIVEEPEAHLYPVAQRELVEFISYVVKATGSHMIITTHSPYILTSLNNLILANNVAQKSGKESEVSEIVDRGTWIDVDKIGVFEMAKGGCEDIVDREVNFIKAEAIDKASDEIEVNYEKLLDIN